MTPPNNRSTTVQQSFNHCSTPLTGLLSRAASQMPTPRERAVREFHATVARVVESRPAAYTNANTTRGSALIPLLFACACVFGLALFAVWLLSVQPPVWKHTPNGEDARDAVVMLGLFAVACTISFLGGAGWALQQAKHDRRRMRLNVQSRAKF